MYYLVRQKGTKKFKELADIVDFSPELFDTYDLYSVTPIEKEQYSKLLNQKKIAELTEQLKLLGVDLGAILQNNQKVMAPQNLPVQNSANQSLPQSSLMADMNITQTISQKPSERMSRVKNPKTGNCYRLDEIQHFYDIFHNGVEKDVQEIEFSSFDENGIILNMTDPRPDLPRALPNGIPVIQIVTPRISGGMRR